MVFINDDISKLILDNLKNCDLNIEELFYYDTKKGLIEIIISILKNIYENELPENIEILICSEIDKLFVDDNENISSDDNNLNDDDLYLIKQVENIEITNSDEKNITNYDNSLKNDKNIQEVEFKNLMNEVHVLDIANIKVFDCNSVKLSEEEILDYNKRIDFLDNIPQPEQRSEEWYVLRNNMLTASDLGIAISNKKGTKNALIVRKCLKSTNTSGGGAACKWGIKYEPISCEIYEKRNNVKIIDYGCIQHQGFKIFGASPDGIIGKNSGSFTGRMLEIKNPISREITGIPPWNYWTQTQGQMEVANLDYCDFLECKNEEYVNEEAFYSDGDDFLTKDGLEKGVIMNVLDDETNHIIHKYCPLGFNKKEKEDWIDTEFDEIINNEKLTFLNLTWWKLVKYSCILIKRDKKWFQKAKPLISLFWESVLHHRDIGCDDIMPKKKIVKNLENKKKTHCLILDSDDEESSNKLDDNLDKDDILKKLNSM